VDRTLCQRLNNSTATCFTMWGSKTASKLRASVLLPVTSERAQHAARADCEAESQALMDHVSEVGDLIVEGAVALSEALRTI
jgi:hypothetical protein